MTTGTLATKGDEVEEWLDLRFFRPIGIRLARALAPTWVSPDQVTMWSLATGLVAGHLFFYQSIEINAIGWVLFIVSDIFDSVDGQLARLRGTSTPLGRAVHQPVRASRGAAHRFPRVARSWCDRAGAGRAVESHVAGGRG
jgi:hypothetical protein